LSTTEDLNIFGNEAVKAIIDFKWSPAKEWTIYMLFLPFIVFMGVFIA
jgi:hypothetical protein